MCRFITRGDDVFSVCHECSGENPKTSLTCSNCDDMLCHVQPAKPMSLPFDIHELQRMLAWKYVCGQYVKSDVQDRTLIDKIYNKMAEVTKK